MSVQKIRPSRFGETNTNYGALLVLLSALMFGSYGVWSRLIGPSMGVFFQGWTRAALILIVAVPIALVYGKIIKIQKRDMRWLVVFLIFSSLTQAPIFYAYNHMDIGTATLLFFVSMFLTMSIIGLWFFGEKLSRIKIISGVMAMAGMYLIFSFSITPSALFPALIAILSGVVGGGEVAFSKKLSDSYSPLYLIILSWGSILVTNGIISVWIGEVQHAPSISMSWFWQICFSLTSLLAFWLVILGFKYTQATVGALVGLTEIVFGIMFGILIFGESLTMSISIGALLIMGTSALPYIKWPFAPKVATAKISELD